MLSAISLPTDFNIFRLFASFSELRPSWGTFLLVFLGVLALFLSLKQGKGGIIRIILTIYVSIAINNFLPFAGLEVQGFKLSNYPLAKIVIFLLLFLILSFLISRSLINLLDRSSSSFLGTFFWAFLASGLLLSAVSILLTGDVQKEFTGVAHWLFINDMARFLWTLVPILAIIFIG